MLFHGELTKSMIVLMRMHPRCHVTDHAAEDLGEDFAESGTLLHYPGGAVGGNPHDKRCVCNKLEKFRRLAWCAL